MIDKFISAYRNLEMGIISDLSGAGLAANEETHFYDEGYMRARIKEIQRELKRLDKEIEISREINDNKKEAEMKENKERLILRMAFLASNSFSNLDDSIRIANGYTFDFIRCVDALKAYRAGKNEEAFNMLEDYYREYGSVENHFLVNKVFGILLAEKGSYAKAVPFLTYSLQFVPDDLESLSCLEKCYSELNNDNSAVVRDIIELLS